MRRLREQDDARDVTTNRGRARRCRRTEEGGGLVEYMLLVALILVVCLVSMAYFGDTVDSRFSEVGSTMALLTRLG
jgi:Flp pilus assembly pilin Flp